MKLINKTINPSFRSGVFSLLMVVLLISGCEKFMDIPLPTDSVSGDGAYQTDNTTGAVITGIFYNMYNSSTTFSGSESVGFRTGLYTDELQNLVNTNVNNQAFYTNNIQSVNTGQWSVLYKLIYHCNLAIEGINNSKAELKYRNQWMGEALFSRAYLYYYVINLYGDGPLAIVSDVIVNNKLGRNPKAALYAQVVADLKQAKTLLGTEFKNGLGLTAAASSATTNERSRPNLYAASSLLARVYLELGDWTNASAEATVTLSNTAVFQLPALSQVFLNTSKEMIWGISPTGTGLVREFSLYNGGVPAAVNAVTGANSLGTFGISTALSDSQVAISNQPSDLRFSNWVRAVTVTSLAKTYFLPDKYKSNVAGAEPIVALRLAEQYLIRAEAKARLNDLSGAIADLDAVRTRAGFTISTPMGPQTDIIAAILSERRAELFTEFGFRFIDLKRTGTIDAVMNVAAPLKGGVWNSQKQFWPIPPTDITSNPNLTQTPGYN
jgi:hypothetical protein